MKVGGITPQIAERRAPAERATSTDPVDRFVPSSQDPGGIYSPRMLVSTAPPPSKVQQALQRPEVAAQLQRFGGGLQQQIRGLSDAQFKVLKGGLEGGTKVGPININHREAFIKGSVLGKSIWGNIHGNIRDARHKHHMINATEESGLHALIDGVAALSKEQRHSLAALLDQVR